VAETDPNAAAFHTIPLAEYTEIATFGQKVAANLMAALGLMCLLLAAIGLYSVMSYTVTQRVPEIGIRIAMGATPGNVIAMVVGQGMALAAAGVTLGAAASLATTRLVSSMLCGVNAVDPLSFVLSCLFLGLVALLAAWLPAFRATRIDPISALRR
jgi:ABC-type antimicrobial peptide transport system permease subunit